MMGYGFKEAAVHADMTCIVVINSMMMPESKKPNDVSMFCDVVVDLLRPIICFIISGIDCLISIWVEQVSVASGFGRSHSPSEFSSSISMSLSGISSAFRMSSLFTQLGKFPLGGSTHPHQQSGQAMYCTALTLFPVKTFSTMDTGKYVSLWSHYIISLCWKKFSVRCESHRSFQVEVKWRHGAVKSSGVLSLVDWYSPNTD